MHQASPMTTPDEQPSASQLGNLTNRTAQSSNWERRNPTAQRTTPSNAEFTPMSQCYMRENPAKINRQPRRLEINVSPTKQTPAPLINRKHFNTSVLRIAHRNFRISALPLIHRAR
jgi:hypothetical protein